jgi:hypothetical protein
LEIHVKSEAELVAEVHRGEMASFDGLVQRYQRAMMEAALSETGRACV